MPFDIVAPRLVPRPPEVEEDTLEWDHDIAQFIGDMSANMEELWFIEEPSRFANGVVGSAARQVPNVVSVGAGGVLAALTRRIDTYTHGFNFLFLCDMTVSQPATAAIGANILGGPWVNDTTQFQRWTYNTHAVTAQEAGISIFTFW